MIIKDRILKHIQYQPPDTGISIKARGTIQHTCFMGMYTSDHIYDILERKVVQMLEFDTATINTVKTML